MISFLDGDMFETPADIRVNTVNCVGVMGAGVALAFKKLLPEMFKDYKKLVMLAWFVQESCMYGVL